MLPGIRNENRIIKMTYDSNSIAMVAKKN